MKTKAIVLFNLIALALYGCSTPEKADLATVDPQEAYSEVNSMKEELVDSQADLLAYKDYRKGVEDLRDAESYMEKNKDHEKILNELAQAKAHFQKAKSKEADMALEAPETIMEARKKAVDSGVMKSSRLTEKLRDIDDDLRDSTDTFTKDIDVDETSEYQKKYYRLETQAVQYSQLNRFNEIIRAAKESDMDDKAPKTYKKARLNYKTAENKIAQNPRTPSEYKQSVLAANEAAKLLSDVMNKLTGTAKGSSEETALQLVMQERKLGKLETKLSAREKNLDQVQSELKDQRSKALSAEEQLRYQKAMDKVRKNFDSNEAEVYQQGDRLILRLKELNFASGSSTIPTESMDLLSKVGDIVKGVKAQRVMIQGHTDSRGDAAYNQKLSMDRAESVAKFMRSKSLKADLEANGYGETKPLANNETKEGRALNRRVDIVVEVKDK